MAARVTSGLDRGGGVARGAQEGAVLAQLALAVGQPGQEQHAVLHDQAQAPHDALVLGRPHRHPLPHVHDLHARDSPVVAAPD